MGASRLFTSASNMALDVGDQAIYDVTTLTVAAWCRPTATTAFRLVMSRDDGSTDRLWQLGVGGTASRFRFSAWLNNVQTNAEAGSNFSTNTWYFIMGTVDGTNIRLYWAPARSAFAIVTTSQGGVALDTADPVKLMIGRREDASSGFGGQIAHAGIWNRALSEAEGYEAMYKTALAVPSGILGYWPIFGVSSPEPDRSGQGKNGTLTNSPAEDSAGPPVRIGSRLVQAFSIPAGGGGGSTQPPRTFHQFQTRRAA